MLLYIVSVYCIICVFCEQDMFEIFNKSTNDVENIYSEIIYDWDFTKIYVWIIVFVETNSRHDVFLTALANVLTYSFPDHLVNWLQVTEEDIALCMGETENPLPEVDQEEHPLRILSEENLTVVSTFTGELTKSDSSTPGCSFKNIMYITYYSIK